MQSLIRERIIGVADLSAANGPEAPCPLCRRAPDRRLRYLLGMEQTSTPPRYTLDFEPSKRSPGSYEWAIRERGKVLQRSDRVHRSEGEALRHGEQELE